MTIGQAWRAVRDQFGAAGVDSAALDARLLGELAFGCDGLALSLRESEHASADGLAVLAGLAARRLAGEPVARLIGAKEFYGLKFALNAATLVPRPETELLVDLGLEAMRGIENPRVLDLGTGTGCIAIALLSIRLGATGIATDLSAVALEMAAANAAHLGVNARLELRQGAWFAPIRTAERFDIIVSNPPYIPVADIEGLQVEVRSHDPLLALDGGIDGLGPYAEIMAGAARHLVPGGLLAVECGLGQADSLHDLFEQYGFGEVAAHDDLSGIARVVAGRAFGA